MTRCCPHCAAADLPADARFCPTCGTALDAAPDAGPRAVDPPPPADAGTHVDVAVNTGAVNDGKVTGLEVGEIQGDVTVHQRGDSFNVQLGDVGSGAQLAVGKGITQMNAAQRRKRRPPPRPDADPSDDLGS
jgi:hypothetical protein